MTVNNNGSSSGSAPATYQVHIPAGAQPSQPGDNLITIDDTSTHTWYSFGEFSYTSATTAVAGQGSAEPDYDSGITFDNSNQDEGVGTLRESDLQAGTIDHMLRINLPVDMLKSVSIQCQPTRGQCMAADGGRRFRPESVYRHGSIRHNDGDPSQCRRTCRCESQRRRQHALAGDCKTTAR